MIQYVIWLCVGGGFSELFDKMGHTTRGPFVPFNFHNIYWTTRTFNQIAPITIGATSHAISLYADETLVYMANVPQTLPCVLKMLNLSGYKVHLSKSALMLINTDQSKVSLPPQINVTNEVLYLGVRISTSLSSVAKTNYSLILKKIEDINRWRQLPASVWRYRSSKWTSYPASVSSARWSHLRLQQDIGKNSS